jgi:outer membrane murein-binding lipoprotein Lpp
VGVSISPGSNEVILNEILSEIKKLNEKVDQLLEQKEKKHDGGGWTTEGIKELGKR